MPALTKRSGSFVALRAHDRKSKQKCLELLKEVMHPTPLRTLIKQINDQRKLAKKRNAKKQTKTPKIKKTISKKSKMPKIKKTSKKVRSPAKRATFTSSVSVPKVADTVSSNVLLPGATRDHIWQFKGLCLRVCVCVCMMFMFVWVKLKDFFFSFFKQKMTEVGNHIVQMLRMLWKQLINHI